MHATLDVLPDLQLGGGRVEQVGHHLQQSRWSHWGYVFVLACLLQCKLDLKAGAAHAAFSATPSFEAAFP